MPTKFSPAPEVAKIARPLLRDYHTHLLNTRVEYVFRDDVPSQKGRAVWGTARKISSLSAFLANDERDQQEEMESVNDPFFVICISKPIWDGLEDEQKTALVDHELMHCLVDEDGDGNPKLAIVGHDFEGFNAEIRRYGLWRPNAEQMAQAMKAHLPQQELPLETTPALDAGKTRVLPKRTRGVPKEVSEKLAGILGGNVH